MDVSQFHAFPNACCSRSTSQWKSVSLNPWVSCKHSESCFFHKNTVNLDHLPLTRVCTKKRYQRRGNLFPFASADDSLTVNSTPQASTSGGDIQEMQIKLDRSLQNEDYNDAFVQSLHDAARVFELAIKDQSSVSNLSWLPINQNAWVKALSYQASVYSLLLAACEMSSCGDERDKDANIFVQKSLSQLCATLENVINDALSDKQPEFNEWFWSKQIPVAVSTFVNYFEEDARETSLLILALSCISAITKLGPTKLSSSQFYSILPETSGRLMNMVVDLNPIRKAYHSIKEIGLRREFLLHFGPRATSCIVEDNQGTEEVLFWVNLVQKQLQRAISRERIWSRLSTSESIEVLEKDLAIFGFFIALGRKTQCFLCAKNFDTLPEPIEELIRHLIGGSVLYYPQLSSISSYQLYVEVVCEELDWLPFYPGVENLKHSHGHKGKQDPPSDEAIAIALDVCSHWIRSFMNYSKWVENPSNVKAARFLSRGHNLLKRSMEEYGLPKEIQLVKVQEKENIIEKSLTKFRKTTKDVLQGTRLLAIDVGAATGLLIRVLTGDKLTIKEKQALRRTLTDLASVVPIGFLMLLPVTAVGHAAMLAAIQRYVPSLIPSTYGAQRLDLLRQLKKVKDIDTIDVNPTLSADESVSG